MAGNENSGRKKLEEELTMYKEKIRNNLIIKVDYEREKTLGGIFLSKHKIYIIGVLPILFIFSDGKKDINKLMAKEEIPIGDPQLRNLMGVKATDLIKLKKYEDKIAAIIIKLEKALKKIKRTKKFLDKPIKDIKIIQVK